MDHITFYFENVESGVSTSTKGFLSTPKNLLKDEKFVDIPQDMLTNLDYIGTDGDRTEGKNAVSSNTSAG